MNGIILAAGKGTRLNRVDLKPKCLFEVGGQTLLERQISALREARIDNVVLVLGFEADRIRRRCPTDTSFVINERFGETSSLYSLSLARDYLTDGFVVLNCCFIRNCCRDSSPRRLTTRCSSISSTSRTIISAMKR
jgi:choline kinase